MSTKTNQPGLAGHYKVTDKWGHPYLVEWFKTTLFDPAYLATMKAVWPLAKQAYLPIEMEFLRAFPQVVGTEDYFKAFEPLFEKGYQAVDWQAAEALMGELLKGHFIYDVSSFDPQIIELFSQDSCYVTTIRDEETAALVGYCTFLARKSYPSGVIKAMSFAVDPHYQNRGLGKVLMFSICKMLPGVKRIFLATRVTNEPALRAYQVWGFTCDEQPILDHPFNLEHWVFLECRIG